MTQKNPPLAYPVFAVSFAGAALPAWPVCGAGGGVLYNNPPYSPQLVDGPTLLAAQEAA